MFFSKVIGKKSPWLCERKNKIKVIKNKRGTTNKFAFVIPEKPKQTTTTQTRAVMTPASLYGKFGTTISNKLFAPANIEESKNKFERTRTISKIPESFLNACLVHFWTDEMWNFFPKLKKSLHEKKNKTQTKKARK